MDMIPPLGSDGMMEGRHDGMTEDGKVSAAKVADIADKVFGKFYRDLVPLAVLDLFKGAVESLRVHIEKGRVPGITWKNPFAQLDYEAAAPAEVAGGEELLDKAAALDRLTAIFQELRKPPVIHTGVMLELTREVYVLVREDGTALVHLPPALDKEVAALPEADREGRLAELGAGFKFEPPHLAGTVDAPGGKEAFAADLVFGIRPLTVIEKTSRAFFPILVGLDFKQGDPAAWSEEDRGTLWEAILAQLDALAAPYLKAVEDRGEERPAVPEPDRAVAVRSADFAVAGTYTRSIFGLSKHKKDMPLLLDFYEPQTPLNWAIGLVMFSMTDEDRVRSGDWQEARISDLEDLVFCLIERDAPRRGDHRTDILAEVVKLHTKRNWYYEVDAVKVGRAWKKRAVIGSQYAIPELRLVFLDTKTGKTAFPTDPALRALAIPLEVKGRRVAQPDGKDIPSLPKGRWKLESIQWRWVQSFNDDLVLSPALEESGKRKGLPKKTVTGKPIRKTSGLIRVTRNVIDALHRLRAEGRGALYASRLLVMLAHNLNKTESGIAADRVFRMLGIAEDYTDRTHKKPEDLVAAAVLRLKQRDIGALLVGSDESPRTDPNPDRRKGPYYRFIRSLDFTPRTGIASREDALAIEAEYSDAVEEDTVARSQPAPAAQPKTDQAVLPGMEEPPAQPIPDGSVIRAAREAAGLNPRDCARRMDGRDAVLHGKEAPKPSFKTWSMIETGQRSERSGRIPEAVWNRVRDFVAQHGLKAGTDGSLSHKGGNPVA